MDSQLPNNGTMNALFNEKTIKKIIAAALVGVILAAGISTTAFSFSWFSNRNNVTRNIEGKTAGAYFARGRGTKDYPFVINRPIHLYNLAWLQDVGYFDSKKTYFIIEKDLDMAGWTLPPIGNEVHPFIGELDGFDTVHGTNKSAVKISNLTISNKFSDFQRHPSSITSISGCNAMGFFGTFGEEKKDYAEDAPVAKNFYLDKVTVKSEEQENLIGSLAGYVNGKISGIGISNSTIRLPSNNHSFKDYTSNLSDYTSIGYCEDKYKNTAYEKEVALQSSDLDTSQGTEGDGGAEAGNGGSIDMNTMYNNLLSIWDGSKNSRTQAPIKRTVTYNLDGTINEAETKVTEWGYDGDRRTGGYPKNTYYYTYYDQKNAGEISSSYTFCFDPDDEGRSFMTLYGRKEITSALTCEVTTITPKILPYRFIADSTGNNYLSMDENGNIVNQTSKALATSWLANGKNQIFTRDNNNTQYFLRNASGSLEITTSSSEATSWTYDKNNNQISNENVFINYSESEGWNLSFSVSYKITDNSSNYWICNNGTTLTMPNKSDSESNATLWFIEGGKYATYVKGTKYFLGISSDNKNVVLTTNQNDAFTFNNGYFSIKRVKKILLWETYTTYYMTIEENNNGNSLVAREEQDRQYQTKIFRAADVSLSISSDDSRSELTEENTKTTETPTYWTKPTYFPISGTNGIPDEKNTGYVVSGAYSATDNDPWGDIRVSIYSKNRWQGLSNSGVHDESNTLETVYTIDDNGTHTVSSNSFDHYTDSKSKFESILAKDNKYISGLHFMDANISKDRLIEAEYVRIKNQEYHKEDGYELPEDAIDFHLQRKGYVNFFAGTYYPNNNAFFSLHEIERNGSKISSIREISEIYENPTAKQAQSYVYKYKDETYSVPFLHGSRQGIKYDLNGNPLTNTTPTKTKPEGYSKTVFKTSWIGKRKSLENYYAYYFEIPTNEGEYALGSVSGAAGAYLCYLDIGANAQRTDITEFHEIKTISVYAYTYPKGVSFSFIEGVDAALPIVDERKSASFSLKESFNGDISVSKSNDSTVQYETTGNSQNVVTEYMFHGYTVKGNGVDITKATGLLSSKIVEDAITKITYSLFNEASSTTIYKKTTVTENGSTKTTNNTLIDGKESSVDWPVDLPWDTLPVKDVATMYVYYVNGKAVNLVIETTFAENYSETEGTHYYKLTGYKVSITNDVDVEVVLTQLKDNTLTIKLKTGAGETEDDYTTLEVNVVTTLTKNS